MEILQVEIPIGIPIEIQIGIQLGIQSIHNICNFLDAKITM